MRGVDNVPGDFDVNLKVVPMPGELWVLLVRTSFSVFTAAVTEKAFCIICKVGCQQGLQH